MDKFEFKKKFGQNFITDKNLITKIVDLASITKNDLVIEVGPGAGALTTYLVEKAGNLLIYEIDDRLESILNEKLSNYNNYKIKICDFLDVDLKKEIDGIEYDKLIFVSNLPYYITTPIIKKFIDSQLLCDKMVLMMQEEVAIRLSSDVCNKEYGSLTVFLKAFYSVKNAMKVSRKMFNPIPNVDSAVIVLDKLDDLKVKDIVKFSKFVKDCFQFKRKNLKNNLKNYDYELINNILNKYGYSLVNRAEEIPVDIIIEIANNI